MKAASPPHTVIFGWMGRALRNVVGFLQNEYNFSSIDVTGKYLYKARPFLGRGTLGSFCTGPPLIPVNNKQRRFECLVWANPASESHQWLIPLEKKKSFLGFKGVNFFTPMDPSADGDLSDIALKEGLPYTEEKSTRAPKEAL